MSSPIRKLAAILAADVAGYRVPVMLVMGHERRSSTALPVVRT